MLMFRASTRLHASVDNCIARPVNRNFFESPHDAGKNVPPPVFAAKPRLAIAKIACRFAP